MRCDTIQCKGFLCFKLHFLHHNYTVLLQKVNDAVRNKIKRMAYMINNDQNNPLYTPQKSLLQNQKEV